MKTLFELGFEASAQFYKEGEKKTKGRDVYKQNTDLGKGKIC